jgi:polyphosphate kinase 2
MSNKPVEISIHGKKRSFDLDDPDLPSWVEDHAFGCGDYPYDDKMDNDDYEEELYDLQRELVKVQRWQQATGARVIIIFEGRDAAGKGGTIKRLTAYLNPRNVKVVALAKPNDRERGEWYYQRYIRHFPTDGEMVIFDRSWYNRGGVEPVMGFCTPEQHEAFLEETPGFERMIVREGIHFFKFWLNVGQEMQLKRFHDRHHNPLKSWKISPIDLKAMAKWQDYTAARNQMMAATHTKQAPWTIVRSNDKRRARLNVLRHLLYNIGYEGKNEKRIGKVDPLILGQGPAFFDEGRE